MTQHETGYLIHKAGRGWYRPEAAGYTLNADEAGRFDHAEAVSYSHPNGPDGPRDGLTYSHESEVQAGSNCENSLRIHELTVERLAPLGQPFEIMEAQLRGHEAAAETIARLSK